MPPSIVILTGAGVSVESGLPSFRGSGGLWRDLRLDDVATPRAFRADPALVQAFYNERRRQLRSGAVRPNAAHRALARLQREWPGACLLVTQNIDDLHERAGSRQVCHMHGELLRKFCDRCRAGYPALEDIRTDERCPQCQGLGSLRPDVVWFGEVPRHLPEIEAALAACDLFLAIGTSGVVYPAAGFVQQARRAGAHTMAVNPDADGIEGLFAEHLRGPAGDVVPPLVERLIASAR